MLSSYYRNHRSVLEVFLPMCNPQFLNYIDVTVFISIWTSDLFSYNFTGDATVFVYIILCGHDLNF